MQTPGFLRRLGSILYDGLVVVALLLLASAITTAMFGTVVSATQKLALQGLAIFTVSSYFIWCWTHGGQTLAMKTWRLSVIEENQSRLALSTACKRYVLACIGLALFGIGIWWALVDKEGLFLHDRLSHTRLILLPKDINR